MANFPLQLILPLQGVHVRVNLRVPVLLYNN